MYGNVKVSVRFISFVCFLILGCLMFSSFCAYGDDATNYYNSANLKGQNADLQITNRQPNLEALRRANRTCSTNLAILKSYMENGAKGVMPTFAKTGDTNYDALFDAFLPLYKELIGKYKTASEEFISLNERFITMQEVLTNKDQLDFEIKKRIASINVFNSLFTNATAMEDAFTNTITKLNLSEEIKTNYLLGISTTAPFYKKTFSLFVEKQKAEKKYYEFLSSNFNNYALLGDMPLFVNDEKTKTCEHLRDNVFDARAELIKLQKFASTTLDNTVKIFK